MKMQDRSYAKVPIVETLPPHLAQSSTVTQAEMDLARRWSESLSPIVPDSGSNETLLDGWLGGGLPFDFRYGNRPFGSLPGRWSQSDLAQTDHYHQQQFVWADDKSGLQVTWQLKRWLDFPAVECMLTFANTGQAETQLIEDVQDLQLKLRCSHRDSSPTVHYANGGRSEPDDMMPHSQVLTAQQPHLRLGGGGCSSNVHLPFFNLEVPDDHGVMVAVGWSCDWNADVSANGDELDLRVGITDTRFALAPGQQVRTARMLMLLWQGQRLHGHNMLRRLLHRHYVPPLRGQPQQPLVEANVAWTYHGGKGKVFLEEATEAHVAPLIAPLAELGVEMFIIDAGWYCSTSEFWMDRLGDLRINKKYPHGFKRLSQAMAERDMVLALWFWPERVCDDVPVAREHPEFVENNTLCLGLPEARRWFLARAGRIIDDEGIGCYRQDGYIRGAFLAQDGKIIDDEDNQQDGYVQAAGGPGGIRVISHINGLYTLWEELVADRPTLIMEGCAGGGRRIDLETIIHFHWHQKSDRWGDLESDQCSLYGANLYLPGGQVITFTFRTDDYCAWSGFAGVFSPGWHPLDDDFPMDQARRQVQRYKSIRPFLSGDFYPLTQCSLTDQWIGYQFHRLDLAAGFALVFRRNTEDASPSPGQFQAKLRGLKPRGRYVVQLARADTKQTFSGEQLHDGIELLIENRPGAELITYHRLPAVSSND